MSKKRTQAGSRLKFGKALLGAGRPPCHNCLWLERCKDKELACSDFLYWCQHGEYRKVARQRIPKEWIFARLYKHGAKK